MNENGTGESHHHEALDADAVCAQCSTINPEGTLICQSCGNNLRDQRALRLQADERLVMGGPPRQKRKVFATLLSVMGILFILYTVLNLNKITEGLMNVNSPKAKMIRAFWEGPDMDLYNDLLSEIEQGFPDLAGIDAALEEPVLGEDLNGFYIIVDDDGNYNERDPMMANIYIEGDQVYFVAKSRRNEIRGIAELRGDNVILNMNDAAANISGKRSLAMGYGTLLPEGVIECSGQVDNNDRQYNFYAVLVK